MTTLTKMAGGVSRFAHFMSSTTRKGKAADVDPKAAKAEDSDDKKDAKADDDKNDEDKMEDDEEEKDAKADSEEDDKDEDGDGDKDEKAEDDEEDEAEAKGRKAERARWAKVFGNKAALGRVAAACTMLADTDMSAKQVLTVLSTIPADVPAARASLGDRMASVTVPNVGAGDGAKPQAPGGKGGDAAAFILGAASKVGGRVAAPDKR